MVTLGHCRRPRSVTADLLALAFLLGWLAATVVYGWAALAGSLS